MKKTNKKKKQDQVETETTPAEATQAPIEVTFPEKDDVKEIAAKDVGELIKKLNTMLDEYKASESPLNETQKGLVMRRVLSFWVANWSFQGARVSIHISDELGYGWEQTK